LNPAQRRNDQVVQAEQRFALRETASLAYFAKTMFDRVPGMVVALDIAPRYS
jgi:hypothetical protein